VPDEPSLIRVVIDTNLIISGTLLKRGIPYSTQAVNECRSPNTGTAARIDLS
jgi:hypothetical protein